jgi:uncharacterized membrane protein YwzB
LNAILSKIAEYGIAGAAMAAQLVIIYWLMQSIKEKDKFIQENTKEISNLVNLLKDIIDRGARGK